MSITRRSFALGSFCAAVLPSFAQGIASRDIKPQTSPASGRPFHARFEEIAEAAGLRSPVIYGGVESKKYILEANGCGCAFIDYDNDGWMDIFLLCGTRLDGDPPDATNRLYKNNRNGTFTDVTDKAGLRAAGWANGVCVADYNNDGLDDIFCTYFGRNRLYRNNGDGTFTDVTKQAGLWQEGPPRWNTGCASWTMTGMAISTFLSRTTSVSIYSVPLCRARTPRVFGKEFQSTAAREDFPPAGSCFITTMATGHSPT